MISAAERWTSLDTMTIADTDQLLPVLDGAPQVRAVLYGHVHQESREQRGGATYMSAPSTFFQFKPKAPTFGSDALPSGARIVHLEPGRFTSAVMRFGEPLPPLE